MININKYLELRNSKEMTQEQLAEILGIGRDTISKWETDVAEPSKKVLIKIADYFNVSTDYLLGRNNTDMA